MKEVVDAPPGILKNTKSCVIEIDYSASRLDKVKMKDVSRHHYFQFEEMGIRAWEFEGIGTGKLMQMQEVNFGNSLEVVKPYLTDFHSQSTSQNNSQGKNTRKRFWCPQTDCSAFFKTDEALAEHLMKGNHLYLANHGTSNKISLDKVKVLFPDKLSTGNQSTSPRLANQAISPTPHLDEELSIAKAASLNLKSGWALKGRQKATRFSTKQKDFLIDLFEKGEKTKGREDPRNVCVIMRNARDERGNKIFVSSEYMRKEQIASFISRLCSQKRKRRT